MTDRLKPTVGRTLDAKLGHGVTMPVMIDVMDPAMYEARRPFLDREEFYSNMLIPVMKE